MLKLLENISQGIQLNAAQKEKILSVFSPAILKKGEHWIKEGKVCNHVEFLDRGKLRVYYSGV